MNDATRSIHAGPPDPRGPLRSEPQAGALPSHPVAMRPFEGFDRERATYRRLARVGMTGAEGDYVVIVGEECLGPVPTFEEAQRLGYATFGPGPLYIKRLRETGPAEVSRGLDACRP